MSLKELSPVNLGAMYDSQGTTAANSAKTSGDFVDSGSAFHQVSPSEAFTALKRQASSWGPQQHRMRQL